MKKSFLRIISVLCIAALVLSLSSCSSKSKQNSGILGAWSLTVEDTGETVQFTFFENGNAYLSSFANDGSISNTEYTYKADDSKLKLYSDGKLSVDCDYKIDGSNLILTGDDGSQKILKRVQSDSGKNSNAPTEENTTVPVSDNNDDSEEAKTLEFLKFSEKYDYLPAVSYGATEQYWSEVPISYAYDYVSYLESCGYKHDLEEESKDDGFHDKVFVLVGKSKQDTIRVSTKNRIFFIDYPDFSESESDSDNITSGSNNSYTTTQYYPTPSVTRHQTKCPKCDGNGSVTCPDCHGTGYKLRTEYSIDLGSGSVPYEVKSRCMRCNGKTVVRCNGCYGKGYL